MRKSFLFIFIIINVILNIICSDVKLGSGDLNSKRYGGKTFEERLKEENLEGYEEDHSMENQMKELIKEYIEEQNLKPNDQIDKETFKKLFVNLIQRGSLRQGNGEILKILADKILEKHGEPVYVKNLEKYFDIQEITLAYSGMFAHNTDL